MEQRIKQVMSGILGVDPSAIGAGSSPETLPQWDSLQHMNLVLAIEEEFGVRFSDAQIPALTAFTALRDAVAELTPR